MPDRPRPKLSDVIFDFMDEAIDDWSGIIGLNLPEGIAHAIWKAAGAGPNSPVVILPDDTLSVAEPECVAEGHATAVFDTDGSVEVWHDPDDGPCEWVYRIEGAS